MAITVTPVPDAGAGLEYEWQLFQKTGPQVGFWTSLAPCLVCPRAYERREGFEAAIEASAARDWPVHLRPTGGGTVPQGPGLDNIVLAFDANETTTLEDVYRLLTGVICAGIGPHGSALEAGDTPGSFCDGAWNLSVGGRKVVGTAQRWRPMRSGRRRVMAHALILTNDAFGAGAAAVGAFHNDLGLSAIEHGAHTSLEAAFGLRQFPTAALQAAADAAIAPFYP